MSETLTVFFWLGVFELFHVLLRENGIHVSPQALIATKSHF